MHACARPQARSNACMCCQCSTHALPVCAHARALACMHTRTHDSLRETAAHLHCVHRLLFTLLAAPAAAAALAGLCCCVRVQGRWQWPHAGLARRPPPGPGPCWRGWESWGLLLRAPPCLCVQGLHRCLWVGFVDRIKVVYICIPACNMHCQEGWQQRQQLQRGGLHHRTGSSTSLSPSSRTWRKGSAPCTRAPSPACRASPPWSWTSWACWTAAHPPCPPCPPCLPASRPLPHAHAAHAAATPRRLPPLPRRSPGQRAAAPPPPTLARSRTRSCQTTRRGCPAGC